MLASSSSNIKIWDVQNFELLQEINTTADSIACLSWNKDGGRLVAIDKTNSDLHLFGISSGKQAYYNILPIKNIETSHAQFSSCTSHHLGVCGLKQSLFVWDVKNQSTIKTFPSAGISPSRICFDATDRHILVGGSEGSAVVASTMTNVTSRPFPLFPDKGRVSALDCCQQRTTLAIAASQFGATALIDLAASRVTQLFKEAHSAPASAISFSPFNDLLFLSVGYDKKLVCYNAFNKTVVMSCITPSPLSSLSFIGNAKSNCVALGTIHGTILIYDLRKLKRPMESMKAHDDVVTDLAFYSSESSSAVVRGFDKPINTSLRSNNKTNTKSFISRLQDSSFNDLGMSLSSQPASLSIEESSVMDDSLNASSCSLRSLSLRTNKKPKYAVYSQMASQSCIGILSPLDNDNSPSPQRSNLHRKVAEPSETTPAVTGRSTARHRSPSKPSWRTFNIAGNLNDSLDLLATPETPNVTSKFVAGEERVKALQKSDVNEGKIGLSSLYDASHAERTKGPETCVTPRSEAICGNGMTQESESPALCRCRENEPHTIDIANSSKSIVPDEATPRFNTPTMQPPFSRTSESNSRRVAEKATDKHLSFYESDQQVTEALGSEIVVSSDQPIGATGLTMDEEVCNDNVALAFPPDSTLSMNTPPDENENIVPSAPTSLDMNLCRSSINDAVDDLRFHVNMRFTHMHYCMIKHIYNMKEELKKEIRDSSLNEELIQEIERLRRENERLSHVY